MCSIDDSERYSVYDRRVRIARIAHRCGECGRDIRSGESYASAKGLYEGFWSAHKTCAHCRIAEEWLVRECGGFMHEGVHEEIAEHALEYPQIRRPLNRLCVGMRKKWQRFDGAGLMPVPALPPTLHFGGAA